VCGGHEACVSWRQITGGETVQNFSPTTERRLCVQLVIRGPPIACLPACPLQMAYTEENWKASRISCNWAAARVRRKINLSSDDAATRVVRAPDDPLRLPRALISDVTSHPISLILSWTTRWRPHSLSYIWPWPWPWLTSPPHSANVNWQGCGLPDGSSANRICSLSYAAHEAYAWHPVFKSILPDPHHKLTENKITNKEAEVRHFVPIYKYTEKHIVRFWVFRASVAMQLSYFGARGPLEHH